MTDHTRSNEFDAKHHEATLNQRLEQCGMPGFELACRYAESQNLEASMYFEQVSPLLTRLSLSIRRPGDELASTYQVLADENDQRVVHEQFFAVDRSTFREETLPTAINDMVMDSRMESFFRRAFNMLLPYLKDRHPPGF